MCIALIKNPTRFLDFKTGEVVLAGNFNFCLNPSVDSTSHAQGMRRASLKMIGRKLHQCQIMDVWMLQHARIQDFTFCSPVHGTYSRLDYMMVDHSLLDLVRETKIGITMLSDHAPIFMQMKIPGTQRQPFTWRLNENLLRDDKVAGKIQEDIEFFFKTNNRGKIPDYTLWDAHKAYIRRVLMSIGAGKKKRG